MNTKSMVLCALMSAVICICAPLAIPLPGGVPVSLATFAVMLTGSVLDRKTAVISTALYLLLGWIGLPVFAGYGSGFTYLFGPTGGFLLGYLPLAYFSGCFIDKQKTIPSLLKGIVIGECILYTIGTVWFSIVTKTPLLSGLSLCVLPFIPGDIVKITAVCLLLSPYDETKGLKA